jgi:MFS family permease
LCKKLGKDENPFQRTQKNHSGYSTTRIAMIASRFVVLFVCGFMQVAVTTYCMELVPPELRMPMRAFANWVLQVCLNFLTNPTNSSKGNARLVLTTVCYFSGGWRMAVLFSAICASPALIFIGFFPESPTWLYHKVCYLAFNQGYFLQGHFKALHRSEEKIARLSGEGKLGSFTLFTHGKR